MTNDESSRNVYSSPIRKPVPQKNQVYSPSANYNFNGNQGQHGSQGGHGNQNYHNQQQHSRRKPNQYKRDGHGTYDRLFKQNDTIIRLLKEIRDRLPQPPEASSTTAEINEQPIQQSEADTSVDSSIKENSNDTDGTVVAEQPTSSLPVEQNQHIETAVEVSDEELDRRVNGNI